MKMCHWSITKIWTNFLKNYQHKKQQIDQVRDNNPARKGKQLNIKLAHQNSDLGQSQIEQNLWNFFLFHDMQSNVMNFVNSCKELLHQCSIQKLGSRSLDFSWSVWTIINFKSCSCCTNLAAQLISSAEAGKVILVLKDIFNTFWNPEKNISDNDPRFSSKNVDKSVN